MGFYHFQPSRRASGPWLVQEMDPTSALTLTLGEPVQRNSSDPEQIEAAAGTSTVTGILGVAMGICTSGVPAIGDRVPIGLATLDTDFLGTLISGTTVQTPVAATHEGVSYGILEVANNWYVDVDDVTHIVVRVVRVLPDIGAVLFRFLAAAIGV